MNILLLYQYFLEDDDSGGIPRWNEMAKLWIEAGHSVTVIAGMVHANGKEKQTEYKGKWFTKKQQGDIIVYRTHVSELYNRGFAGRMWGYFSFMFSSLWVGIFKVKGDFDAIIVSSPPLFVGVSGYLISLFKNVPMIFEVRDLWPESAIDTGILKNKTLINLAYKVESFIYKKSRLINVLTPATYATLKNIKGIDEKKLTMIPNAANFLLADETLKNFNRELFRKDHGLDGKFVITYVGAHGAANCLEQLIDAALKLKDTNVLFLLIGQGMMKESLKQKAKSMNVDNLRFLPPVSREEVFKYIIASEMGISVLKKADTFKTVYSNKTFDYFSCKKPILMAIDGISRELVETAKAGSYVEPENVAEYNKIIREYLANPSMLAIKGENGYRYAKENFDRNVLAQKYIANIEESILKSNVLYNG